VVAFTEGTLGSRSLAESLEEVESLFEDPVAQGAHISYLESRLRKPSGVKWIKVFVYLLRVVFSDTHLVAPIVQFIRCSRL
jgi:hypothetical protein